MSTTYWLKPMTAIALVVGGVAAGVGLGSGHDEAGPERAAAALEPKPTPVPLAVPAPFVTAWGKPAAGLQAGVRVRADQLRLGPGQTLDIEVVVRNVRDGCEFPSSIRLSGFNSEFVCHVTDGVAELRRSGSYNGPNPMFSLDLSTGGQARLGSIAVETVPREPAEGVVNRLGKLFHQWKPGIYRVGGENVHTPGFSALCVENWPAANRDEREYPKLGTGYLDVEVVPLRPTDPIGP